MNLDTITCADVLDYLATLPDNSVDCAVSSPPYFGLRDYGVVGQIGLEPTPAAFVATMVTVYREVRRVLKPSGTCWINLGDSYNSSSQNNHGKGGEIEHKHLAPKDGWAGHSPMLEGVKPKSLLMIPARVAIALQDDGWILRSEIVWAKPNPMPESVTDRPTKAHEMVYLLTKEPRYWYDAEAVREANSAGSIKRFGIGDNGSTRKWDTANNKRDGRSDGTKSNEAFRDYVPVGRSARSVWTIPTEANGFAHFATFPQELVRRCVLAGCPAQVCEKCGKPWERVMSDERTLNPNRPQSKRALQLFEEKGLTQNHLEAIQAVGLADVGRAKVLMDGAGANTDQVQKLADEAKTALRGYYREFTFGQRTPLGFQPTCKCGAASVPGICLDPFMGSGTTALVARSLGRHYIGCELNPAYIAIAKERLRMPFEQHYVTQETKLDDLPLFGGADK